MPGIEGKRSLQSQQYECTPRCYNSHAGQFGSHLPIDVRLHLHSELQQAQHDVGVVRQQVGLQGDVVHNIHPSAAASVTLELPGYDDLSDTSEHPVVSAALVGQHEVGEQLADLCTQTSEVRTSSSTQGCLYIKHESQCPMHQLTT